MSDTSNFCSNDDVLSWLKQFNQKVASVKHNNPQKADAPSTEAVKATKKKGVRKKIRAGELLSMAKDMLSLLNSHYRQIDLDDFFNPITLDSHRRRLGPDSIEGQIADAGIHARNDVLRFLLDIIDFFNADISIPSVKPSVVFWTRKSISAFINSNPNTVPEASPWKELHRNIIAAEIIKAVEDAWFTGGYHMREFSNNEATRIFESSNSIYSEFQESTWGY